jgi:hypothetical protein
MAYNDKRLKTDLEEKPIPQAYNPDIDDYEPVHSTNNALNQVIYGPNGQPISTVGNKLAVRATELEALMQGFATEGKLEQVRALLQNVSDKDFAKDETLEQARALLNTLSTKDFATSSNQDALKTVVDDLKSELLLVKSELDNIKQNQTSGNQKVQLSGTLVETVILHNEIAIADTNPYGVNLDVSKYKAFNIWIRNTLNQPIKVRYDVFLPPGKGNNTNHFEWKDDQWSQEDFKTVIPPGGFVYNLTSIIMPKHRFTRMIRLVVRCDIAPTSGSILSWVEGELR